jgi:hypothetical protein
VSGGELFASGGIDDRPDFRNPVGGEATHLGVLADHGFIGRDVDAIDLVVGDEALNPLNLGPQLMQYSTGSGKWRAGLQATTCPPREFRAR